MGHKSIIVTKTEVKNRRGVWYKDFCDGLFDRNFHMVKDNIAEDIFEIALNRKMHNEKLYKLMHEVWNTCKEKRSSKFMIMHTLFSFGYMQGIRAERKRSKI